MAEDLLERVRRIVGTGTSKEKRLSKLLEKGRRQWRKEFKRRNVSNEVLKAYKPEEADMVEQHESLLHRLTMRRREMREGKVQNMQQPMLEKILDSIVSDIF